MENMNKYQLKHYTPKSNLQIVEWTNKISIAGDTYSEIASHKLNL